MKKCPTCHRVGLDEFNYCGYDGTPLDPPTKSCGYCGGEHEYFMFGGVPVLSCPAVPRDKSLVSSGPQNLVYPSEPIAGTLYGFTNKTGAIKQNAHMFGDGDGSLPIYEEDTTGTVNFIESWTCDNHPPGLEVSDVPIGDKCPVCERRN